MRAEFRAACPGRSQCYAGSGYSGGYGVQLGMIGLGRMGANMVRRLLRTGHSAVAFDFSADKVRELAA